MKHTLAVTCAALCALAASAKTSTPKGFTDDLDAALRRAKGVYRLRVIHGYHGGTALRDGIRKHYAANKAVLRVELGLNPGETDLVLREF